MDCPLPRTVLTHEGLYHTRLMSFKVEEPHRADTLPLGRALPVKDQNSRVTTCVPDLTSNIPDPCLGTSPPAAPSLLPEQVTASGGKHRPLWKLWLNPGHHGGLGGERFTGLSSCDCHRAEQTLTAGVAHGHSSG